MHHHLLLNKTPILDSTQTVFAYQLSLTPLKGADLTEQQWSDEVDALWSDVNANIGFSRLIANKPVFYKAPLALLKLELLPKIEPISNLYVEVDVDLLKNKEALASIKEMMRAGVKVAVQDYQLTDAHEKLLSIAKLVKINPQTAQSDTLDGILEKLSSQDLDVVVTDIDSEESFQSMRETGIKFFQGYFFTNPVIASKKEISTNKLALLKLLAEVNNPDVDFNELAATIGSDMGLTHKLLAAINHPQNDLPYVVESLKEAVNFMGLKRLKFWVNMLMLSEVDDVPQELLMTALVRAKFLEMLADALGQQDQAERFFIVGLFSTLNAFLKEPMVDIVDELPLSQEVKEALLNQKGAMGKGLFIARSMEQGNTQVLMTGFEGMDIMAISDRYMGANGWALDTLNSLG